MKNSIAPCLLAIFTAHCLCASISTSEWRLEGEWDSDLYYTCHPVSGTPSETCAYPYYDVSVPNDGVAVPITNPLVIANVFDGEYARLYDTPGFNRSDYSPDDMGNCTFTLEDGFQFTASGSYELIAQAVTSISCVPHDGSSSEEVTTAPSVISDGSTASSYPTTSATFEDSTTPPYPTASTNSALSAIPPYPTSPTNSSAANSTIAVSSTSRASNTEVAPGGKNTLVPFTGDASSVRGLCSIPALALLVVFSILR